MLGIWWTRLRYLAKIIFILAMVRAHSVSILVHLCFYLLNILLNFSFLIIYFMFLQLIKPSLVSLNLPMIMVFPLNFIPIFLLRTELPKLPWCLGNIRGVIMSSRLLKSISKNPILHQLHISFKTAYSKVETFDFYLFYVHTKICSFKYSNSVSFLHLA